MARTSECTGAYFGSISITATERPVDLSGSIDLTLPTGTPEIRTSASLASWVASAKDTWKRYPFGLSGIGPPKASHRNSSRPKHDSAKITIAAMRPSEGALLTTAGPRFLARARAQAGAVRAVEEIHERAQLRVGLRDRVQQRS